MVNKRTPKMEVLVVKAIRRLQDVQGSTAREINDYISHEFGVPPSAIKKSVQVALKRALNYGILKSKNGHYVYNTDLINDHQNDKEQIVERASRRKRPKRRKRTSKSKRRRSSSSRNKKKSRGGRKRSFTDAELNFLEKSRNQNKSQSDCSTDGSVNQTQVDGS